MNEEAWKEAEERLVNAPPDVEDSMASLGLNGELSGKANSMIENVGKGLRSKFASEMKAMDRHGAKNMKEFATINRETYDRLVIHERKTKHKDRRAVLR